MSKDSVLSPLILLAFSHLLSTTYASNETCPTWFYRTDGGWCTCGSNLVNVIICNNETGEVGILSSFCLTSFDSSKDPTKAVVGSCLYGQNHGTATEGGAGLYVRVAPNITEQDEQLCGYLNRQGRMCGACKPNHYVSAYSYDLKCYQCRTGLLANIFAYIAVAYVPQTLFLAVVVWFRISFTSPRYTLVILLCQIYSLPESLRILIQFTRGTPVMIFFNFIATLYGVWNLDFFRGLVPPICLPLNTLQVTALDYLTAAYPLLLLVFFYALVTAHDRGCRPVARLLKPCFWCVARTRRHANVKNSIIDAFATFILLSYMKLMYTSVDLLIFEHITDIHGSRVGFFLYYDSTIELFGPRHRPYAILAVTVISVGLLFPLFLVLYPTDWFQRLLNRLHLNSSGARTFVECFQGNYRDRTNGGWECRYFSAVYPLMRLVGSSWYAVTRDEIFFPTITLIVIAVIAGLVILRPYKKRYDIYNNTDILLLLSTIGFISGYMTYALSFDRYNTKNKNRSAGIVISGIFTLAPLAYFIVLLCKWTKEAFLRRGICCKEATNDKRDYEDLSVSRNLLDSSGSINNSRV